MARPTLLYREVATMNDCKPVSTPVNSGVKLTKCEEEDEILKQKRYQAAVVGLLYLSTKTRSDMHSNVACFCAKPTNEHWTAMYLKGTSNLGLFTVTTLRLCVLDTLMQTGREILVTESQHLATCFYKEVLLLVGRATNSHV